MKVMLKESIKRIAAMAGLEIRRKKPAGGTSGYDLESEALAALHS